MIDLDLAGQSWREHAECGRPERNPRWWDDGADDDPVTTEYAVAICVRVCRVRTDCLDDALARREEHTVRGGYRARERMALLERVVA